MPKFKITYSKTYEAKADFENEALGFTDQEFMKDIREMLSQNGKSKIGYLFNFKIEEKSFGQKMKKNEQKMAFFS